MSDAKNRREHPVLSGLAALLGAALALGLVVGVAAMVMADKVAGSGPSTGSKAASSRETLYAPEPSPTEASEGPQVTLAPDDSGVLVTAVPSLTGSPSPTAAEGISLSIAQSTVSPMQQIDLSGTYGAKDTAILQVQRFENDVWTDFPVTVSVNGGRFSTYVMTARTGENKFRVMDTDNDATSNEVTVTIG